jgi:hypothetical protein
MAERPAVGMGCTPLFSQLGFAGRAFLCVAQLLPTAGQRTALWAPCKCVQGAPPPKSILRVVLLPGARAEHVAASLDSAMGLAAGPVPKPLLWRVAGHPRLPATLELGEAQSHLAALAAATRSELLRTTNGALWMGNVRTASPGVPLHLRWALSV